MFPLIYCTSRARFELSCTTISSATDLAEQRTALLSDSHLRAREAVPKAISQLDEADGEISAESPRVHRLGDHLLVRENIATAPTGEDADDVVIAESPRVHRIADHL